MGELQELIEIPVQILIIVSRIIGSKNHKRLNTGYSVDIIVLLILKAIINIIT